MKISDILKQEKVTLSLEVFPPKTSEKYESTAAAAKKIAALHPDFMSVTYGAGGGTGTYTAGIAEEIQKEHGVTTLAHLTCVSSSREHVLKMLKVYEEKGIENILALRGDIPQDGKVSEDYRYAAELIRDIHKYAGGKFCLGGACYPEGHVECLHKKDDIGHLKDKVDAGLDFLTTQMFFDNNIFYNFLPCDRGHYADHQREAAVPVRGHVRNRRAAALPRHRGLLRRRSGGNEAGRHHLRHGADRGPDRKRDQAHPRVYHEQAVSGSCHHGEPLRGPQVNADDGPPRASYAGDVPLHGIRWK